MKNIEELKAGAAEVFKANEGLQTVIATEDGNYFLPSHKSYAKDHARKTGIEMVEISREDATAEVDAEETKKAEAKAKREEKKAEKEAADKAAADKAAAEKAAVLAAVQAAKEEAEKEAAEAAEKAKEAAAKAASYGTIDETPNK